MKKLIISKKIFFSVRNFVNARVIKESNQEKGGKYSYFMWKTKMASVPVSIQNYSIQ